MMQRSTGKSIYGNQIELSPLVDEEVAAMRFIPDPFARIAAAPTVQPPGADAQLAKLTYGCVEWFDYQQHPVSS